MRTTASFIMATVAALGLAACGDDGPGNAGIRAAIVAQARTAQSPGEFGVIALGGGVGALPVGHLADIRISSAACIAPRAGVFSCSFSLTRAGMSETLMGQFRKVGGSWMIVS